MNAIQYIKNITTSMVMFVKIKKKFFLIAQKGLLREGEYYIWWSDKPLLYKKEKNELCHKFPVIYDNFILRILSKKPINVEHKDISFDGEAILLTLNNEYKIFDFKNGVVLSKISENKRKRLLNNMSHFTDFFKTTLVETCEYGIIEKYVGYKKRSSWNEDELVHAYITIVKDQVRYTENIQVLELVSTNEALRTIKKENIEVFAEVINYLGCAIKDDTMYPSIWQHGDVHFGNILFADDEHYYIDFEYSRIEIFLFDIINCIYVEMAENDSFVISNMFFSEKCIVENYIKKLFENLSLKYNSNLRKEYFYAFLVFRIRFDIQNAKERFAKCPQKLNKYYKSLRDKYLKVIKYLEEL